MARPSMHTFSRTDLVFGLAAEGGKANKPTVFLNMCGFWALAPLASKKTLGQQNTSDTLLLNSAPKSTLLDFNIPIGLP